MNKEALQYIVGLSGIHTIEYEGEKYSSSQLHRVPKEMDGPDPIEVSTLSGFMDYVAKNDDRYGRRMYIQIVSPTEVRLVSALNMDNQRDTYIKAKAVLPSQNFGSPLDQERFLIWLRTGFVPTEKRDAIVEFCGCVTGNDVVNLQDDGISQKVSISTYVGTQDAIAPTDPVLAPFRTFIDIEQPESPFVFRTQKYGDGIGFVLYEADGGAWKTDAMNNILEYIRKYMDNHADAFKPYDIVVIC
ncbi:MAG: hypothetical protein SPE81_06080 [Agathobacter sp.]|nr:hypothetical protein [Agathobacter sp.]